MKSPKKPVKATKKRTAKESKAPIAPEVHKEPESLSTVMPTHSVPYDKLPDELKKLVANVKLPDGQKIVINKAPASINSGRQAMANEAKIEVKDDVCLEHMVYYVKAAFFGSEVTFDQFINRMFLKQIDNLKFEEVLFIKQRIDRVAEKLTNEKINELSSNKTSTSLFE